MTDLEKLLDDDFEDVVPLYLKTEGINTELINQLVAYIGNDEIYERLSSRMNPKTRTAATETLRWLAGNKRKERIMGERGEIYWQFEALEQEKREIFPNGMFKEYIKDVREGIYRPFVDHHRNNLSELGLPEEKIGTSRILMSALDMGVSNFFHHDIDKVESNGFGPYAMIGYPIRKGIRYFMLQGAQK